MQLNDNEIILLSELLIKVLKHDIEEAIAIRKTEPKLVNHEISTAEDELLSQLNKAK